MTRINIQPAVYHKGTATSLEIRYINYTGPTAVADCHLWTDDGREVEGFLINATAEQCAAWDSDIAFAAVLASNANPPLLPTDPVTEWTPPAPPSPEPAP